jgi:hypothetical protein
MNRPIDPYDLRSALHDLASAAPSGDDALLARTHERIAVHRRRRIAAAVTGAVAALALVVGAVSVLASDDDGVLVETPDVADVPTVPVPDADGPSGELGPPDGILAIGVDGVATVYDAATLSVDEDRSEPWRAAFEALGGGVLELHHTGGARVVALVDRDDPEGCFQVAHVGFADGQPVMSDLGRSNDVTASVSGVAWLDPCPGPNDVMYLSTRDGQIDRLGEQRLSDVRDLALSTAGHLAAVSCTSRCTLTVAGPPDPEAGFRPFTTPSIDLDGPEAAPCAAPQARVAWLGARIAVWSGCADAVTLYDPSGDGYVRSGTASMTGGPVLALEGEPGGERLLVVRGEGPSLVLAGADGAPPRTVAPRVVAATWIWSGGGEPQPPVPTSTTVPVTTTTAPESTTTTDAAPTTTTPTGPVVVPDVVRLHQDDAIAALEDAGFEIELQGDEGEVFWQEPPGGAIVGPASRRVTLWSCGPGADCVVPPPSWLDDPSTTQWGPLAGPAWDDLRAEGALGATVAAALATIADALEPSSEIYTVHTRELSRTIPDCTPAPDAPACRETADVLVLERGLGDDSASGADHRLTLALRDGSWILLDGESRARCTRAVTSDGTSCL